MEQAQTDIIENAKTRVIGLDWKHFGLQDKTNEIANHYDIAYPLILRNAGMNFPLNLLQEDVYNEAMALRLLDPSRKTKLKGRYFLALTKEEISVEEATLIRDWLAMKAPEEIAVMNDLSPKQVTLHFLQNDKAYFQAAFRTRTNLVNRGSF